MTLTDIRRNVEKQFLLQQCRPKSSAASCRLPEEARQCCRPTEGVHGAGDGDAARNPHQARRSPSRVAPW